MSTDLKKMSTIIAVGGAAGDKYTTDIEKIHTNIVADEPGNVGATSSIGQMVKATLGMTKHQIEYDTTSGIAKNAANQVKTGAQEVKKQGG
jgi:hypothetical protein